MKYEWERTILDSKGREHLLEQKLRGVIPSPKLYLDGKLIVPDDRYGWIFTNPYGSPKPIRDKELQDTIDGIVFGRIIPTGVDEEEE